MWFFEHLKSLREPTPKQKIWSQHPERLTIVFIEGNSNPLTKCNLWNIAHVYGGTDVGLHIVCSSRNLEEYKEWTKDWTNVVITRGRLDSVEDYNTLLRSPEFYTRFISSHILITQWDSYIFRKIVDSFFEYDYVGAPWQGAIIGFTNKWCHIEAVENIPHIRVGNGGFSLRNVNSCYEFCLKNKDRPQVSEDIFFCVDSTLNIPSKEIAYNFAVESKLLDCAAPNSPVGMHKLWQEQLGGSFGEDDFKRWCR